MLIKLNQKLKIISSTSFVMSTSTALLDRDINGLFREGDSKGEISKDWVNLLLSNII
jgi:hypothetical protein